MTDNSLSNNALKKCHKKVNLTFQSLNKEKIEVKMIIVLGVVAMVTVVKVHSNCRGPALLCKGGGA